MSGRPGRVLCVFAVLVLAGAGCGRPSSAPGSSSPAAGAPRGRVFAQAFGSPQLTITAVGVFLSWSASPGRGSARTMLARVDLTTGRVLASRQLGAVSFGQAVAAAGSLWVTISSPGRDELLRLDPASLALIRGWQFASGAAQLWSQQQLAVAGGRLWLTAGGRLLRMSLPAGQLTAAKALPGAAAIATNPAGTVLIDVKASTDGTGVLQRRDPATGALLASSQPIYGVAAPWIGGVAGSGVWVSVPTGMMGVAERYDTATVAADPATMVHGTNAIRAQAGDGLVWITDRARNFCADLATGHPAAAVSFPQPGEDTLLAVGSHLLYYAAPGPGGADYIDQEPVPAGCLPPPGAARTCPSRVSAAALSAVTFLGARAGLGVWPAGPPCGPRLAVTTDGGRTWRATGSRLPGQAGAFSEAVSMIFPSARAGWAAGGGVLDITRDGGAHWTRARLGGAVQAISASGPSLWAFVAPCPAAPASCRYRLEAATLAGTSWHEIGLLPAALGNYGPLVITRPSASRAVVAMGQMTSVPAYLTTDGGREWAPVSACQPPGYSLIALATTGRSHVWALCLGGAAAGTSAKSLLRSADGGRTWTVVAEDRSLQPGAPRPVPDDEGDVLAAPSDTTLWFAGANSLWGSSDGGSRWFRVPAASTGGASGLAAFSFTSPTRGWLLIPRAGLWRTTDGQHWQRI